MGKKYIINSAGNIVAQRDIYSLGGFIPKGTIGAAIANESVLSQDGESWITTSDKVVPATIRVKDNAFIWNITGASVLTGRTFEFSGDTYIPCNLSPQNASSSVISEKNLYVHSCYIGSEVTTGFGPISVGALIPTEQGAYNYAMSDRGKTFDNLTVDGSNAVRTTISPVIGDSTQLYVPAGMQARIMWAWQGSLGNYAYYSGDTQVLSAGLHNLTGNLYKLCRMVFFKTDGTNLTPAQLQTSGVAIIRTPKRNAQNGMIPIPESNYYTMKNCSFRKTFSNFNEEWSNAFLLSGFMENCNVEYITPGVGARNTIQGVFKNVYNLRIVTNVASIEAAITAGRDTQIVAENCPYLAIDNNTVQPSAIAAGGVTLRNCILPKGQFIDNPLTNVYENIDFSFASEHVGASAGNTNFQLMSGTKQGLYLLMEKTYKVPVGIASYPGNVQSGAAVGRTDTNNPTEIAHVTGYSYIGPGVYIYGNVQLHSQPYINRWISANMWERGTSYDVTGQTWDQMKRGDSNPALRFRVKTLVPVRQGDVITCGSGYQLYFYLFNEKGICTTQGPQPWGNRYTVGANVSYVTFVMKKTADPSLLGDLMLPTDVLTAAVKYQSTPRTLRYITNEADRTSPEDTLLGPDAWRNGYTTNVAANVGKTYDSITDNDSDWLSGKSPINADPVSIKSFAVASTWVSIASSFSASLTLSAASDTNKALYAPSVRKDPKVAVTPNDISNARVVLTYQPCARIVLPYGRGAIAVRGNVRLYDNSVMAMTTPSLETNIVLRGNTVLTNIAAGGYQCSCTEGDEEAIINT